MSNGIPFQLRLTGESSDQHQFQGYDGYMALAGFAWTLSLAANYVETGIIRHRGDFPGRHAVRAGAISEGSVLVDFMVWIENNPAQVLGLSGGAAAASAATTILPGLVKRIIDRNLGEDTDAVDPLVKQLISQHGSAVEELVASSEASIRQSHGVIGNGAKRIEILGGHGIINTFDEGTKDYVKANVEDSAIKEKQFSVTAFSALSGYGSVYDSDLQRTIPVSMNREVLRQYRSVFTWGLDQYANRSGKKISARYWRILSLDGRSKRYVIIDAERSE